MPSYPPLKDFRIAILSHFLWIKISFELLVNLSMDNLKWGTNEKKGEIMQEIMKSVRNYSWIWFLLKPLTPWKILTPYNHF